MKIIGIDPGYAIVGVGVIEASAQPECLYYSVLRTSADMNMPDRLKSIYTGLCEVIEHFRPDAAAIETLFFSKNTKTALLVAQARGVAILSCVNSGVDIFEYSPVQVKQSVTGYGKAEKMQVQLMITSLLNLRDVPRPDDAADALAVAMCHMNSYRSFS